jgi:lysozyme
MRKKMTPSTLALFRKVLIEEEGMEFKPYRCPSGKLTIGVGRNLDDVGISEPEALFLLETDIKRCAMEAEKNLPWFPLLTPTRQIVILSMIFNLGLRNFLEFEKMIKAVSEQNYALAAKEMLASRWAQQVGNRAKDLAVLMKIGRVV